MEHTRSEPQLHTDLGQRRRNGHGPLVAVVVAALDDLTDALLLLLHLQLALWRLGPANPEALVLALGVDKERIRWK